MEQPHRTPVSMKKSTADKNTPIMHMKKSLTDANAEEAWEDSNVVRDQHALPAKAWPWKGDAPAPAQPKAQAGAATAHKSKKQQEQLLAPKVEVKHQDQPRKQ